MRFNKFPHPSNARFPQALDAEFSCEVGTRRLRLDARRYRNGVFRTTWRGPGWEQNHSRTELTFPPSTDATPDTAPNMRMWVETDPLSIQRTDAEERVRLETSGRRAFGVNGEGFVSSFSLNGDESFYGMGEKFLGLELSGKQTKFWNTDVVGDFSQPRLLTGHCDPACVSIPYVILHRPEAWVGILVNIPGAVFVNTGASLSVEGLMRVEDQFMIGPALMQAPVINQRRRNRDLPPPPGFWWDFVNGLWIQGNRTLHVEAASLLSSRGRRRGDTSRLPQRRRGKQRLPTGTAERTPVARPG